MYSSYERYSTGFGTRFGRGLLFPLLRVIAFSFLLYLLLSRLFITTFQVDSASMRPILEEKDRLLVSTLVFGGRFPFISARLPPLRAAQRGEIVVVESPAYVQPGFPINVLEPVVRFLSLQRGSIIRDNTGRSIPRYMIKRIIGTPGDTVKMSRYLAYIKTAGSDNFVEERELLGSAYSIRTAPLPEGWGEELPFSGSMAPIALKQGEYFLLGDNRPDSSDSRSWGPVSAQKILGKAFYRYWPISRGGKL